MPEEIKLGISPEEEKLSLWQRINKWVIGGVSTVIVAGGIIVGVSTDKEHADKPIYVVNPVTEDTLWFKDTIEARPVYDSLIKIGIVKQLCIAKTFNETKRESTFVNTMKRARYDLPTMIEGDIVKIYITINDKDVKQIAYINKNVTKGMVSLPIIKLDIVETPIYIEPPKDSAAVVDSIALAKGLKP